jgi:hypothetical protein
LVSLEISGCSKLTNRSLIAIKHHCHHSLRSLDISFVRSFSAEVLFTLVYSCQSLEKLHMWGCTQFKNNPNEMKVPRVADRNLMDLIESKSGLEVIGYR